MKNRSASFLPRRSAIPATTPCILRRSSPACGRENCPASGGRTWTSRSGRRRSARRSTVSPGANAKAAHPANCSRRRRPNRASARSRCRRRSSRPSRNYARYRPSTSGCWVQTTTITGSCSARSTAPLHPGNVVRRDFRPLVEAAKLPRIRFHDLRHAHVSYLALAGVPIKVAQERVGHSSASMTLDVYSHVLPGMQADVARKFEALLLGQAARDKAPDSAPASSD
jgi:hypothetical protein